ncbi:MAG: helix-turn-helix domain-containing protein [Gammaproteobacteria bacterium]|nr:helix-turn-helix domain-containing protein [Gammaproteobacteria bacterium]
MAGHHPWSKLRDKLTSEQRERAKKLSEDIELGMLLAEIRKHTGLTQQELADRLGVSQPSISQIEAAGDMHVTTLTKIVTELGGELILHMPSGDISLT